MPVRQYLDNTVVPLLLQAMTEVAKVRYSLPHPVPKTPSSSWLSTCSSTRSPRKAEEHPKRTSDPTCICLIHIAPLPPLDPAACCP
jgi:hypothetical protein